MQISMVVGATSIGAALLLAACGGPAEPLSAGQGKTATAAATAGAIPGNTAARSAPAPATTTGHATIEGCEARTSTSGGPVMGSQGPYYHQVVIAHTADGIRLSGEHQVLEHASVPDGVRMPDGTARIYYINALDGGIWVARVDGDAVTPIGPISMNGVTNVAGAVDPDATLMPDGTIRLAYFASSRTGGSQEPETGSTICIAESADGVAFRIVARAIHFSELTTDPTLVKLGDGNWLMGGSQGRNTVLARSTDGLQFTVFNTLPFGGVAELAPGPNGAVRLYVCERGMVAYLSTDSGETWQREAAMTVASTAKIVCDPSRVVGTDLFVFKTGE